MGGYIETYRGVVLDNADPLSERRVQVLVPEVSPDESMWARPEQAGAALPAAGEEVSIRFENGDASYPIWSSSASAVSAPDGPSTPTDGFPATYRGLVLDNVDPAAYLRVLVEVPEVAAAQPMWATPEQAGAALPAVGGEVWVRFENGDPARPTWSA